MVDHELDEHFRRSLGADYMNLFGKRLDQLKSTSSATGTTKKSPQPSAVVTDTSLHVKEKQQQQQQPQQENSSSNRDNVKEVVENIEMSVDDHFAKALGDTWKQLQQSSKSSTSSNHDDNDVISDPENDSNANDDDRSSPKSDISNRSESQSHR